MQTFHSYQTQFVVTALTNFADELELADNPSWHAIASAGACLERIMHGEQPANIAEVVEALKLCDPFPKRCGKFTFLLVDLSITLLEGVRLGLVDIVPKLQRPPRPPFWIGIDMGTGDRTVFGGRHHA